MSVLTAGTYARYRSHFSYSHAFVEPPINDVNDPGTPPYLRHKKRSFPQILSTAASIPFRFIETQNTRPLASIKPFDVRSTMKTCNTIPSQASPLVSTAAFASPVSDHSFQSRAAWEPKNAVPPSPPDSPGIGLSPTSVNLDGENLEDCLHPRLCDRCFEALVQRIDASKAQELCRRRSLCSRTWNWIRQACSIRARRRSRPRIEEAVNEQQNLHLTYLNDICSRPDLLAPERDFPPAYAELPPEPDHIAELPNTPASRPYMRPTRMLTVTRAELDTNTSSHPIYELRGDIPQRLLNRPQMVPPGSRRTSQPFPPGCYPVRPEISPGRQNFMTPTPLPTNSYPHFAHHSFYVPQPTSQDLPPWATVVSPNVTVTGPAYFAVLDSQPAMLRQQAYPSASFATTDAQHGATVEQHHNPSRSSYATVSALSTTRSPTGNSWSAVSPQSSMSSAPVVATAAPFVSSQTGPVFAQAITDSPKVDGEGGNDEVPPLNLNNTSQNSAWSSMTTAAELEGSRVGNDEAMHAVAGAGAWTTEAAELEGTSPRTDSAMFSRGYSELPPNHISELPGEFDSRGSTFIGTSQTEWMMAVDQSNASLPSPSQSMFPQSRNPPQALRRQFSFDSTPDVINVRRYGIHDNQVSLADARSTCQDMWQQHTSSCHAPERQVSSSATTLLNAQASHPSRNDSPVGNGFQFPSDARSQLPSQQRASPQASAPSADAWWLAPDARGLEFEGIEPRGCRPCNLFPQTGSQGEKRRKIMKHLTTDRHRANVGLSRVEKTHCPVPNCRAVRNRGDNLLHHLRNQHPEFVEQHPEYRAQRPAQRRRRASTSFLIGR